MSLLSYLPPSLSQYVAGYPPWLVITVAAWWPSWPLLWILGKLVRWALTFLLVVLGAGICALLIWLVWQAFAGSPVPGHHP